MYSTLVALAAIAFLLARGAETANTCLPYDYCDEWTARCLLNNAVVSISVFVSLATTRVQCSVTRHLVGTSERGVCHVMSGPATGVESCMRDNIGSALAVLLAIRLAWMALLLAIEAWNMFVPLLFLCIKPWQWLPGVYEKLRRN